MKYILETKKMVFEFWKPAPWYMKVFAVSQIGIAALSGWFGLILALYGWIFLVPAAIWMIDNKKI